MQEPIVLSFRGWMPVITERLLTEQACICTACGPAEHMEHLQLHGGQACTAVPTEAAAMSEHASSQISSMLLQEQQMAELNGNLPMLSSLAQSGSTRAGSDLARAFSSSHGKAAGTDAASGTIGSVISSSHHNGLPVVTSSKQILPAVVTEPNEAGYRIASALASDLPGLQERARISELAQEAHLSKTGLQVAGRHYPSSASNTGAGMLARMHDIVFHEAGPNDPSQQRKPEPRDLQQRSSDHGQSAAAIAAGVSSADMDEDKAAVHYTVPSGPAKMLRWPVMPKLASSGHLGAPRKMFETGGADDEEMRVQLRAASVAGLAGAATRRLLLQATDG